MYVGHAAIALAIKSRRPDVPIVPLALACYGPDWIDVVQTFRLSRPQPLYSHSIPAIVVGALLASALYRVIARRPGGGVIMLGWLTHWPADLFTAHKPLLAAKPLIGMDLYHLPVVDFVMELFVVGVGCALYWRAFARTRRHRQVISALAVGLAVLQFGFLAELARTDTNPWKPLLADVP